jgi:hypothetical protein
MDCLTEANKVSTLARRRENPKALFADAAPGMAQAAPRGFLEAPSVMLSATRRPAAPERQALRNPAGRLPKAGLAQLRRSSAGSSGGPRAFGMQIPAAGRLAGAGRTAKPAAVCQTTLAGRDRKLRKITPAASMGNAFRVSARVAFRQLRAPARVAATERAGSRLAYGEMGFTGSPDAPAPAEWVGLVLRKGLGRESRIS